MIRVNNKVNSIKITLLEVKFYGRKVRERYFIVVLGFLVKDRNVISFLTDPPEMQKDLDSK